MNRSRNKVLTVLIRLIPIIPSVLVVWLSFLNDMDSGMETQYPLIILMGFFLTAVLFLPATKSIATYYTLLGSMVLLGIIAILIVNDILSSEVLILTIMLTVLILYEPFPLNLIETTSVTLVIISLKLYSMTESDLTIPEMAENLSVLAVSGLFMSISGSLMSKYRELIVEVGDENIKLKNSVVNLTRTNTQYLDFAVLAQEKGMEKERMRITRDIHDIVGYTLTNNMMLMEAALDIMKENPLALPAIVETARSNAEEGLKQVRETMYQFRDQEPGSPTGLNILFRLGQIFEKATSVKVKFNFGNALISYSDEIDSTLFHLIQESLVNSFRHGNGTEVNISFWCTADLLKVYVQDNGRGAKNIHEGIGLNGMRERIEKLNGTLEVKNVVDGFLVYAVIPLDK